MMKNILCFNVFGQRLLKPLCFSMCLCRNVEKHNIKCTTFSFGINNDLIGINKHLFQICISCIFEFIIFKIVTGRLKLTGNQNKFVLNVLFSSFGIEMTGIFRGLGIIDRRFVGGALNGDSTTLCSVLILVARFIWNSDMLVLLPLTIDRFLAIMFPFFHRVWLTDKKAMILISSSWLYTVEPPNNGLLGGKKNSPVLGEPGIGGFDCT